MRRQRAMTASERFFWKNAGFSYDPKTETKAEGKRRCAKQLAEAEAYAQDRQWSYEWPWDDAGCSGCCCENPECKCSSGEPHETLGCVLKDEHGKVLESLWGICDPSQSYVRVVEAELALEAIHQIDREIETLDAH